MCWVEKDPGGGVSLQRQDVVEYGAITTPSYTAFSKGFAVYS